MYLFQKKLSAAFTAFVCLIFILSACKSVDPEKEKLAKELEKAEKERRDQWFQDTDGKKIAPERDMVEEMLKSSPFKLNTGKKPENPYPIYTAKDKKNNKTLPSDLPVKDATAQKIKAEFNFNAAPVGDVIQAFASILNLNYLLDDKINGNITLFLNEHLNRRELFSLFQNIPGLSKYFPADCEGYLSNIRLIAPKGLRSLGGRSNLYAVPLSMISATCNLNPMEETMLKTAMQSWCQKRIPLWNNLFPGLLGRLQMAYSTHESGTYTFLINTSGAEAVGIKLRATLRLNTTAKQFEFYEFIFY